MQRTANDDEPEEEPQVSTPIPVAGLPLPLVVGGGEDDEGPDKSEWTVREGKWRRRNSSEAEPPAMAVAWPEETTTAPTSLAAPPPPPTESPPAIKADKEEDVDPRLQKLLALAKRLQSTD